MWLVILDQDGKSRWYELKQGRTTVGRGSDNDLVLVGAGVSRHHAVLKLDEKGVLSVEDQDSTYGTRVSGVLVRRKVVQPGDPIDVGVFRILALPEGVRSAAELTTDRLDQSAGIGMDTGEYTLPALVGHQVVMGPPTDPSSDEFGEAESSEVALMAPAEGVHLVDEWGQDALARVLERGQATAQGDWEFRALNFLQEISKRAAVAREAGSTLRKAVEGLADLLRCETAVILEAVGELDFRPLAVHAGHREEGDIPVSRTVVNRAVRERSPVVSENLAADPEFRAMDSVHIGRVGALLAMPMLVGVEIVGVLYLSRKAGIVFSDEEIQLAEVVAAIGAAVIRVHRLTRQLRRNQRVENRLERLMPTLARDRLAAGEDPVGLHEGACIALAVRVHGGDLYARDKPELAGLMADLFGALDEAATRNGGRLALTTGEALVALFGFREPSRTDAVWATTAGFEFLVQLGSVLRPVWGESLKVGVCLDYGQMVWGLVSWPGQAAQILVGRPVTRALNLAGRYLGKGLVATEETLNRVSSPAFDAEFLETVEDCRVYKLSVR